MRVCEVVFVCMHVLVFRSILVSSFLLLLVLSLSFSLSLFLSHSLFSLLQHLTTDVVLSHPPSLSLTPSFPSLYVSAMKAVLGRLTSKWLFKNGYF